MHYCRRQVEKGQTKKTTPWVVEIALMQLTWTVRLCERIRNVDCAFVWARSLLPDNIEHIGVAGFSVQRLSSPSITYCHPPATHRSRCRWSPVRSTCRDSALSSRLLFSKYCTSRSSCRKQSLWPRRPARSISASDPTDRRRFSICWRYGAAQASGTRSSLTIDSAARTLASTP